MRAYVVEQTSNLRIKVGSPGSTVLDTFAWTFILPVDDLKNSRLRRFLSVGLEAEGPADEKNSSPVCPPLWHATLVKEEGFKNLDGF